MANEPVDAERGDDSPTRAARWYPVAVVLFGLISVALVALVPTTRRTSYGPVTGLLVLAVIAWTVWRSKQPERAVSDCRIAVWVGWWLVLYLLVLWVLGPDLAKQSAPLWAALGVLTALPPFIEAGIWVSKSKT